MERVNAKVDSRLHEKMKNIIKIKGRDATIFDEYNLAIRNHIEMFYSENVISDSGIGNIIEEKVNKVDKHLASMLGRTGMDVSMLLIGMVYLLQKEFSKGDSKIDEATILEKLRIEGARYYTGATKKV